MCRYLLLKILNSHVTPFPCNCSHIEQIVSSAKCIGNMKKVQKTKQIGDQWTFVVQVGSESDHHKKKKERKNEK